MGAWHLGHLAGYEQAVRDDLSRCGLSLKLPAKRCTNATRCSGEISREGARGWDIHPALYPSRPTHTTNQVSGTGAVRMKYLIQ
jgi:hypothetical protein